MIIKNVLKWHYLSGLSLLLLCSPLSTQIIAQERLLGAQANEQKQWVGQSAPSFKLQDQSGRWHQLEQYRGKWIVLYFYPKDNTAGCTEEAKQFKSLYPQFLKANTVVFGVSMDDVKSHQKFSEKLGLPFPILADNQGQLAHRFGIVRNLGITKIAKRESFLIDPKGIILFHYSSVNTQTHAAQVLDDLKRFQQR